MKSVKVVLEFMPTGEVDIKASTPDLGTILLVMEKAKMQMLQKLILREESPILTPNGVN